MLSPSKVFPSPAGGTSPCCGFAAVTDNHISGFTPLFCRSAAGALNGKAGKKGCPRLLLVRAQAADVTWGQKVNRHPIVSLYAFYVKHAKQLQSVGYLPVQTFWLNFACVPFLPWDEDGQNDVCVSQILRLYLSIYRVNICKGMIPGSQRAFMKLLEERYVMVQQMLPATFSAPAVLDLGRFALPGEQDDAKCTHAGLVVLNTKSEWESQKSSNPIPCRLVQDICSDQ